jgi:hypothetical protein
MENLFKSIFYKIAGRVCLLIFCQTTPLAAFLHTKGLASRKPFKFIDLDRNLLLAYLVKTA